MLFGVHKDYAFAILLILSTQNQTKEPVVLYHVIREACYDSFADMCEKNTAMWKAIFIEDIDVVEVMQKSRLNPIL